MGLQICRSMPFVFFIHFKVYNSAPALLATISQSLNPRLEPWRPFHSRELRASSLGVHFIVFKSVPSNRDTQSKVSRHLSMSRDAPSEASRHLTTSRGVPSDVSAHFTSYSTTTFVVGKKGWLLVTVSFSLPAFEGVILRE